MSAMSGDLTAQTPAQLAKKCAPLKGLAARHGYR